MVEAGLVRRVWREVEPLHAMIYFVPEAAEAYARLGITDMAMGYFGSRAAPLGRVPAEVVTACFYNFNPDLVRHAIPAAWDIASPEALLEARTEAADRALRRALGDLVAGDAMAEAAALARQAATAACDLPYGRPLFAAHSALPWPDAPHLVLWHAQTLLREFRGDGHIAALVLAGLSGLESNVLHAAAGEGALRLLRDFRAWSREQWDDTVERFRADGLIVTGEEATLTEAGKRLKQSLEDRTDEASTAPYAALGEDGCERLRELVRPMRRAVLDAGLLAGAGK